mmetsp:Transcript_22100/g.51533  ORF Transcript_22100/g.51533 Transcript_22100/m.51533 type:complete len:251 (+) Transcript_22100:79-831(+)
MAVGSDAEPESSVLDIEQSRHHTIHNEEANDHDGTNGVVDQTSRLGHDDVSRVHNLKLAAAIANQDSVAVSCWLQELIIEGILSACEWLHQKVGILNALVVGNLEEVWLVDTLALDNEANLGARSATNPRDLDIRLSNKLQLEVLLLVLIQQAGRIDDAVLLESVLGIPLNDPLVHSLPWHKFVAVLHLTINVVLLALHQLLLVQNHVKLLLTQNELIRSLSSSSPAGSDGCASGTAWGRRRNEGRQEAA